MSQGNESPGHDWNMPHDVRAIEAHTDGCPPNCPYRRWAEAQPPPVPAKHPGEYVYRVTLKWAPRKVRIGGSRQLAALKGAHRIHGGIEKVERVRVEDWEDVTSQHV